MDIIKSAVWLIGLSSIIANVVVLFWGCVQLRKEKSKRHGMKQKLLIVNLAAADLLMGIYLLILGAVDAHFGSYFPLHAETWRISPLCKVAAVLSVLSSEASLFFLTLISLDRFWVLSGHFSNSLLPTRMSRIVVIMTIWALAVTISIIPVGLEEQDFEFSQVCIGLPLARRIHFKTETNDVDISLTDHERVNNMSVKSLNITGTYLAPGYSIGLFLGVNFFCCVTVAVCYSTIFCILIHKHYMAHVHDFRMSVSRWKREVKTAYRMGLIVLTDLLCWMPIVIIGILVQTSYTDLSPTTYAWVIAFALPINSAVNPFLYAIGHLVSSRKQRAVISYRRWVGMRVTRF